MSWKVPPESDENIEDHPKSDPKGRKDRQERQLNGNPLWTARIVKAREKLPSILLSDEQLQFFLSFFFKKSHLSVANALLFKRWNEPIGCHKIPQGAHEQRLDQVTHLGCGLDSN